MEDQEKYKAKPTMWGNEICADLLVSGKGRNDLILLVLDNVLAALDGTSNGTQGLASRDAESLRDALKVPLCHSQTPSHMSECIAKMPSSRFALGGSSAGTPRLSRTDLNSADGLVGNGECIAQKSLGVLGGVASGQVCLLGLSLGHDLQSGERTPASCCCGWEHITSVPQQEA